jgi:hypothetical protein
LCKALDEGDVDVYSFKQLAWGERHKEIEDDDLAILIQKLLLKDHGAEVAIEILSMRFHKEKGDIAICSQKLVAISREILLQYPYEKDQNRRDDSDYQLAQIVDVSMGGQEGAQSAKGLCQSLVDGFQKYQIYSFHYPQLLGALARIQPYIFLDAFIGRDEYMFRRMLFDDLARADSPVNQIQENILIDWCEQNPGTRYPLVVSSMQMYSKSKDSDELCWHPILQTIFEKTPNMQAVLSQLENEIYPISWSGSRADAMSRRFSLFAQLFEHPSSEIRDWAVAQKQKLETAVQAERERELKENQKRFESFE